MSFLVSRSGLDIKIESPVVSLFLFKILTNHLQYLWIILAYPYARQNVIDIILKAFLRLLPNPSEGVSIQCFLRDTNIEIGQHYYSVLVISIFPLIIFVVCFIYLKIFFLKKENLNEINNLKLKFSSTFRCISLIIFFMLYSNMVKTCLESFLCKDIGDFQTGKIYMLVKDLKSKCYETEHIAWILFLVSPILLIIGIILPLYLIFLLYRLKKKNEFDNKRNLFRFGFFYYGYKSKYYYWEMIIQMRKLTLILINIILTTFEQISSTYQILIYLLFIEVCLILNLILKPYKSQYNMILKVENLSFYCLLSNFYFILFALPQNGIDLTDNKKQYFSLLGFLINFFFIIPWVKTYVKYNLSSKYKDMKKLLKVAKGFMSKKSTKVLPDTSGTIHSNKSHKFSSKIDKKSVKKIKPIFKVKKQSEIENLNAKSTEDRFFK